MKNKLWLAGGGTAVLLVLGIGAIALTRGGQPVARLAAQLRGNDAHLRHEASRKLAKLGPAAKEAVPALAEALADPDRRVRVHSAKALSEVGIDAQPAVHALIIALKETDPDGRYYVIKTLSKLDLDASHAPAVPGLTLALKDENPKTRYFAIKCLKDLGSAAQPALPALKGMATDADKEVRDAAASAVKRVSRKA